MKRFSKILLLSLLAFIIFIGSLCMPAYAHRANIFCEEKDGVIKGEVYFSGGRQVRNANLKVMDFEKQHNIEIIRTDAEGLFEFKDINKEPLVIIYDDGAGHYAECRVGSDAQQTNHDRPVNIYAALGLSCIAVIFGLIYIWKRHHAS